MNSNIPTASIGVLVSVERIANLKGEEEQKPLDALQVGLKA